MLNLKRYANGRFFDTDAKEYIKSEKLAEIIKKGEKIQVTLAKTGKDITDTVFEQFSKKAEQKQSKGKMKIEIPFLKTDKMTKWLGQVIDTKIEQVMDIIKLPSREQVARLDENIKELNKKIDALELSQGIVLKNNNEPLDMQASPKKTAAAGKTGKDNGKHNGLAAALSAAS
ncbi:polyhydroxyalkanoate synthesis regulator DNA-binding domain-containing protein [Desulfobacterales bacterium HSG17]|nr:polyhydroxyalkanoate synthesis regulator DNA-binding domain-containing protein [Desulfobacterales bacterium HSG17]